MSWVPLHVHSQYSILDSTASVQDLAQKAAEFKMPALALTDQGNLFGAVDFYKACKKAGVKPIIGAELFLAPESRHDKKRKTGFFAGYPLVLLAKNTKGYQNLCRLSSLAYLEGFYYTPRIDKELLSLHSEGLICLSGPLKGFLSQLLLEGNEQKILQEIEWQRQLFKEDYFFEITRHARSEEQMQQEGMDREGWFYQAALNEFQKEKEINKRIKELSKQLGIGCVATNDSRYINKEDWQAHEILMNIGAGETCEIWERDSFGNPKAKVLNPKRSVCFSHELYFKSSEEMAQLFSDFPEAVAQTLEVANRCNFTFDFKTKYYPVFIPPSLEGKTFQSEERTQEAEKFLKNLCEERIAERYSDDALEKVGEKYPGKDPRIVVKERLAYELEIITSKGMCDYLLIVYDFISWAKNQGIPMGPGRGSGAGSIICYLTGITDIEPLRFNLFFERFINPERISYPDIDVDICMERRAEVIEYTVRKYGQDKVAQIITFGTMKAKMAIKDVGRVLSIPLAKVNSIAKLVPEDPNMTLSKALELDSDLRKQYETDEETRRLIDLAKSLEGCVRNTGIHAAGLIISADPIVERIPVCTAKDTNFMVTQFSMKPVEEVGMLKIDFLGLKTLTAIQTAVDSIQESQGKQIDWVALPLEDKTTFDLLNQGKTLGIFQLESTGMQELSKQLHIDKFEEIIAVGALYRPGPMEMIPSFISRKHGKETIEIDHPLIEGILAETYGIMVYQEQVMQMASLLASYTLGEGDVLRRAMGKKDREEMARQREKFRQGALKNGIDEKTAMHIFDKVEKFASYGFNKSHAAAYGYLSYVTAYLKANYPMHWMAALMTTDRDDLSKVTKIIHECQTMGISILPPDVNESGKIFAATARGIRFALTAIKGIGEAVVENIIKERKENGPFKSLYDFFKRVDTSKVGKKTVEHLIEAGSFDFTGWPRQAMIESIDLMYERAHTQQQEKAKGILNLFSLIETEENDFLHPPEVLTKVTKAQILRREKELLGFYLTGHPLSEFESIMKRLSCVPLSHLSQLQTNAVCRCAFIIEDVSVKIASKSGKKFAILTMGDENARYELPIWSELFEEKQHLLIENQLIYAVLLLEKQEGELKLQCRWLDDLTTVNEQMIQACDLAYDRAKGQAKMAELKGNFRNDERKKKETKLTKEEPKKLYIRLNAEDMKLSHVLELKSLLRTFPGDTSVHLEFIASGDAIAALNIDSTWGVEFSDQLAKKLSLLPAIINHNLENK